MLGEEMGKIVPGTSAFLESLMACTSAYHELWEWVERDIQSCECFGGLLLLVPFGMNIFSETLMPSMEQKFH